MKRLIVFSVTFALLVLVSANLYAAKVSNVTNTVHNLSAGPGTNPTRGPGTQYRSDDNVEEAICIFCHTPHAGRKDEGMPLWNRSGQSAAYISTYVLYNSATLSTAVKPSTIGSIRSESMACLACHDGTIAVNRIINQSKQGDPKAADAFIQPAFSFDPFIDIPAAKIGADRDKLNGDALIESTKLNDDHPISFSYFDADLQDVGINGLHTLASVETAGLKLYGANAAGGKRVECGTCHDPHIEYFNDDPFLEFPLAGDVNYAPFLRIPNTGSKMCLSCHNK